MTLLPVHRQTTIRAGSLSFASSACPPEQLAAIKLDVTVPK
jgi:hypothetical protein